VGYLSLHVTTTAEKLEPYRVPAMVAAGIATAGGIVVGGKVASVGARRALRSAKFAGRVATLTLYRRCPDCATLIHADARCCRHCGHRIRPARGVRP
jgi:hypothetical protein